MTKAKFRDLIEDLYTIYNPDHLKYLDQLTEKYWQMPTEAVEMTLMKYNHPSFDYYEPEKNSMNYYQVLIKSYSMGQRILQNVDMAKEIAEKRNKEIQSQLEEAEKSIQLKNEKEEREKREAEEKLKQIQNATEEKLQEVNEKQREFIEKLQRQLEDIQKNIDKPSVVEERVVRDWEDDVEVTIKVDIEEKLVFPNVKHLTKLGIGARVVTMTEENRPIGLVIKDILFDNTSTEIIGKPEVLIILEKA